MTRSILWLMLLGLTACAVQPALTKATQSGLPEARFRQADAKYVRDKLALACASTGSIVNSSDYSITCSKRNDSGRGFMAQALLGNACSDTPMEKIEFTTVQAGSDVFVTARGWMEIKKCFGDVQRVEYDKNNNFRNEVQTGLDQAVARHENSLGSQPATTSADSNHQPFVPSAPTPASASQAGPHQSDPAKRCDACARLRTP